MIILIFFYLISFFIGGLLSQAHAQSERVDLRQSSDSDTLIIEDALGCRKTVPFIITQPDELFTEASQDQPVQCYGFDDGVARNLYLFIMTK